MHNPYHTDLDVERGCQTIVVLCRKAGIAVRQDSLSVGDTAISFDAFRTGEDAAVIKCFAPFTMLNDGSLRIWSVLAQMRDAVAPEWDSWGQPVSGCERIISNPRRSNLDDGQHVSERRPQNKRPDPTRSDVTSRGPSPMMANLLPPATSFVVAMNARIDQWANRMAETYEGPAAETPRDEPTERVLPSPTR